MADQLALNRVIFFSRRVADVPKSGLGLAFKDDSAKNDDNSRLEGIRRFQSDANQEPSQ